jgi:hypothetical protein
LELAGPAAPVPPFFWATWGVGQWSLVAAVLTLVLGVAVPYAIRHHQRKDAQRDEQRKERTTALREISADVVIIEKKLEELPNKPLSNEAIGPVGARKSAHVMQPADTRR